MPVRARALPMVFLARRNGRLKRITKQSQLAYKPNNFNHLNGIAQRVAQGWAVVWPRPAAFSDPAPGRKGNDDGTAGTLVPGPNRSEAFIAQRRHLTRSLF